MFCPLASLGILRQNDTNRWTLAISISSWRSQLWIPPDRCSDERGGSHGWHDHGGEKTAEIILMEKSRRFASVSLAISGRDGARHVCACRRERGAKRDPAGHRRAHGHSRGERPSV